MRVGTKYYLKYFFNYKTYKETGKFHIQWKNSRTRKNGNRLREDADTGLSRPQNSYYKYVQKTTKPKEVNIGMKTPRHIESKNKEREQN